MTGYEVGFLLLDLTTFWTYNGSGEVATIDPLGYGTADRTTFTYDEA